MSRKKIFFLIPRLAAGGAEQVFLTLLRHIDRQKYEPGLVTIGKLTGENGQLRESLAADVRLFELGLSRVRYSVPALVRLVRSEKPDVIISTLGHLNVLLLSIRRFLRPRTNILVRETNTVSEDLKGTSKWWFKPLIRVSYAKADKVICQATEMMRDLVENFSVAPQKAAIIHNPVDLERIESLSGASDNPFPSSAKGKNILCVGRLSRQKRFDKAITAFSRYQSKNRSAQLWIIGQGPLQDELESLCSNLGISGSVHFVGFKSNPYSWMKNCDLFMLTSQYEGLPNVLLEALACGCPVVAVDCPGGVREILELTENVNRLLKFRDFSIEDSMFEPMDVVRTRELLKLHFGVKTIVKQYEKVFEDSINSKKDSARHLNIVEEFRSLL